MKRLPNITSIPGWLTVGEAELLHLEASGLDCIEIGSYVGRSSVAIATAARSLHCVDPFDGRATPDVRDTFGLFKDTLEIFNCRNVTWSKRTFAEYVETCKDTFGFAFLDAEHTERAVIADLLRIRRILEPTGTIAVHDYGHKGYPDVKKVCDNFFERAPDALVDSLAIYYG